ncbi:MAG: helix-turn-helix transcriptional regulator [Romboutsia sp.]
MNNNNRCKINIKNISKIRKLKHISQVKLALKIGVTQSTISRIENNKESPTLHTIENIATALDVCPFDLMSCSCKRKQKNSCKQCQRKIKGRYYI